MPHDLPQPIRDRLDAARERFDVVIGRVEPGDERCWGRTFGFWRVEVWPLPRRPVVGPCGVEWTDLAETVTRALDIAEQLWPE